MQKKKKKLLRIRPVLTQSLHFSTGLKVILALLNNINVYKALTLGVTKYIICCILNKKESIKKLIIVTSRLMLMSHFLIMLPRRSIYQMKFQTALWTTEDTKVPTVFSVSPIMSTYVKTLLQ